METTSYSMLKKLALLSLSCAIIIMSVNINIPSKSIIDDSETDSIVNTYSLENEVRAVYKTQ